MKHKKRKVAVGLSGGVDSSVAAALLRERGYDVTGLSMQIYNKSFPVNGYGKNACYGPNEEEDIRSAARVCKDLGIPFHVIDLKKEFEDHVIRYFRREYLKGRTPNPCVVCNHRLKFGFLLSSAKKSGIDFDFFATGHYARVVQSDGRFLLKRALDRAKDQTYFLYALTPGQLSRTIFPLGEYQKKEVKARARALHLKTFERAESQDFITGGDYTALFAENEIQEGDIVNDKGEVLGRHRGIIHYTIGQRRGIGIARSRPLYVTGVDAGNNRLVVGERGALFSKGLIAGDVNLISVDRFETSCKATVKIRQQHREAHATIFPYQNQQVRVLFDEQQMSVTPGQSAVFYQGDTLLGGGIIERAIS